jgi:competence protein ComGC
MFCPSCGTKNDDSAALCTKCHKNLKEAPSHSASGRQTDDFKSANMMVVDGRGHPLGFGLSLLRAVLIFVSALPLGAGMWWAAIDKQGRSWPDMILGTKKIDKSGEVFRLPAMISIIQGLSLFCISALVLAFCNFIGLFSLCVIDYGISASLVGLPVLYIITLISGFVYRHNERAKQLLSKTRKQQIIGFIVVLFLLMALPSSSLYNKRNVYDHCERDIKMLGQQIETYAADKGRLPDSLALLVQDGYMDHMPVGGLEKYKYWIETTDGERSFMLAYTDPGRLKKDQGLRPAKTCKSIMYIQGRGLVVETE